MKGPVHDEVAAREQAVADAKQRVADCEADMREGERRAELAQEPLLDYYRRVGAGEGEDAELEQQLKAQLAEAQRGLTMRAAHFPYGGGMGETKLVAVDAAAEARLEGAREALRDREGQLAGYVGQHLGELAAERAPGATELAERINVLLGQVRGLAGEWERERSTWARWCVLADREALIATVPDNPLRAASEMPAEAGLPLPEPFWA
jgi:hypothetical protein